MTRICFVCDEIFPTRPGGAGSLIYNLASDLLSQGHQVILLLNLSRKEFERFNNVDRLDLPNPNQCHVYHVASLCEGAPFDRQDFRSRYDWESCSYDFACRQVYQQEQPDFIEFVDFCGPAYYALCAKRAGLSYQHSYIVIRMHGAIELIDRYAKAKPLDYDRYTIYSLEHNALRMADVVLYPTPSFLQEYYSNEGKTWLGETCLSPPPVKNLFSPVANNSDANIVLFYGRLYVIKGVDLFVDAAVAHLNEDPNSTLEFHLVGYDSLEPPVENYRSYQGYLLSRIPVQSYSHFTFHGFISPERMAKVLKKVKFAIFPSYFETYCLAAHELRRAGVPLILSSIPAFRDLFQPGVDALFFDGSMEDLANQIARLDSDQVMRRKLSRPPTQAFDTHLDFYQSPSIVSSVDKKGTRKMSAAAPSLLVCILVETTNDERVSRTLASLEKPSSIQPRILCLQKSNGVTTSSQAVWLLGDRYILQDSDGHPIATEQARTQDALLVLRAGDEVTPDYLSLGLEALHANPGIAFVTCWKSISAKNGSWLNTFPLAAMVEIFPFASPSPFTRSILRTPQNVLLVDLLDPRAGVMAEILYLWKLTGDDGIGLQIPAPMVAHLSEIGKSIDDSLLSYLVLQDTSPARQVQLTRYLAILIHTYPALLHTNCTKKDGLLPVQGMKQKKSIFVKLRKQTQWIRFREWNIRAYRRLLATLHKLLIALK